MASQEFENFDKATRKILSVPREDLKRREKEWKKEHGRPRGKRNLKTQLVTLEYDSSYIEDQISELLAYFPHGVTDELISKFFSLSSDLVLGEPRATGSTGQVVEYSLTPRFGGLEDFVAALRAYERGARAK